MKKKKIEKKMKPREEVVRVIFEDGQEKEDTIKNVLILLKECIKLKAGDKNNPHYGFCPTLDIDEEGYVKRYQKTFSPVEPVQKWYYGEICPRCKKEHKFPIKLNIRPKKT